jgi:diadenylate cyclase
MTSKLLTFFALDFLFIHWSRWLANGVDLIVIFVAVYAVITLLRRTQARPIAVGFTFFTVVCWLFQRYVPSHLGNIFRGFLSYLPIFALILFLPDIRPALMSLGMRVLKQRRRELSEADYDQIVLAALTLASIKTGALIVIERGVSMKQLIARGVKLDAELSYDLLISIFNTASPLHDGAVVIQGERVAAASCFGPISLNPKLSRDLGTRHRAAIGISEDTDAVVVVVSEETGLISFSQEGKLRRGLDGSRLREALNDALGPPRVRHLAEEVLELEK